MTRTAISPRLAMSTFENTPYGCAVEVGRAISALSGTRFASFDWVDECGSTNAELVSAAQRGDGERVLGAESQTAGRGRLGRVWQAPPGASVLCSVLVRPGAAVGDGHLLSTALGLAAAEACEEVSGVSPGLKWPNDLVIEDRKLAGILAESHISEGRIDALIIGIGINVNWPVELPEDLAAIAVSLNAVCGHDVNRTDLVVALLGRFERWLAVLEAPTGAEMLRDAYVRRSATIGRRVRVEAPEGMSEGLAVGVEPDGRLIVDFDGVDRPGDAFGADRTASVRRSIAVGDVIHLRPVP